MCTRTLSTCISTSSSSMRRLSHALPSGRPGGAVLRGKTHEDPEDEPADVREEGDPARLRDAQRSEAVDQLEEEPEAEHDHGRDVEQLVEEPEEDQRGDPCAGEQDDVRPERRGDRPGCPDRGRTGRRIYGDLRQGGDHAPDQVEDEEPEATEPVLHVVPEDPQVEHVAEEMQPAAVQEL